MREFGGFFAALLSGTFFSNLSTRPAVSTSFCLPVKNGMAVRADFDADVAFMGGTRLERVLARADHVHLIVGRVDSSFHFCTFQGKFHLSTGVN